jgi:hypothetical protein
VDSVLWADVEEDGIIKRKKRAQRVGPNTLSRAEAKRAAKPMLEAINDGGVISSGILLRDFIPEWRRLVTPTLKPSTVEGMESSIRAHILPVLGNVLLSNLDARRTQDLVNSMRTQAKKIRVNVVSDLMSILTAARGPQWRHQVPAVNENDLYIGGREPADPTLHAGTDTRHSPGDEAPEMEPLLHDVRSHRFTGRGNPRLASL